MIKKLKRIAHISDVHIRNHKRHDEYRRVFEKLYESLRESHTPETLILLTGDIVHSKTDVTPELVDEVQSFLRNLSEIGTTLLIPGNHDCNLSNSDRLDALTPIVNALDLENLIYFKDSGIKKIGDIDFYHWSVFDKKSKYPKPKGAGKKVCLYHSLVNNSTNDFGYIMRTDIMSVEDFVGFDLVLLGDIHTHQYLNEEKTIAYPGSLIQQSHGESIDGHGYLQWDCETLQSQHTSITNDTAFWTVDVADGLYSPLPQTLPPNLYLRVRHSNTTQSQLKSILRDLKSQRNVIETALMKVTEMGADGAMHVAQLNSVDFRNVANQNEYISTYLSSSYGVGEEDIAQVMKINEWTNAKLSTRETPRNTVWTPISFEFDNMFGYRKGNRIDFSNMRGTYGIFAPNASGKSTLLDAITYCLFDKCSKTNRASEVMNNASVSFNCIFRFELNGNEYTIERRAKTQRGGNVRVEVDFYYLDESGTRISLNGKERGDTNSNIRKLLGSYEDFVLTSFSTQTGNASFIDINQRERKELLCQFMDLNVFEDLYNIANEESREASVLLKDLERTDWYANRAELEVALSQVESQIERNAIERGKVKSERTDLESQLLLTRARIKPIDSALEGVDKHKMIAKELRLKGESDDLQKEIEEHIARESELTSEWNENGKQLGTYDREKIDDRLGLLKTLRSQLGEALIKLKGIETEYAGKLAKMEKLKDLKYDKDCKFCMDNVFVKDAIKTSEEIDSDKSRLSQTKSSISEIESMISLYTTYETLDADYRKLQKLIDSQNVTILKIKNEIAELQSDKKSVDDKISQTQRLIESYIEHESAIGHNAEIQVELSEIKTQSQTLSKRESQIESEYTDLQVEKNGILKDIDKCAEAIGKMGDLQTKRQLYQWYLDAIHRDGIPHRLIAETLPQIEEEVNGILSQLVEFRVILGTDNKNINGYITYGDDRIWGLELVSGMEKFITSLAIRSALISISSLPRPDFLIIDEGFGVLSKDNMDAMHQLFEYLKSQFRFSLIISHVERMRDMMDNIVEITKTNGVSQVNYS